MVPTCLHRDSFTVGRFDAEVAVVTDVPGSPQPAQIVLGRNAHTHHIDPLTPSNAARGGTVACDVESDRRPGAGTCGSGLHRPAVVAVPDRELSRAYFAAIHKQLVEDPVVAFGVDVHFVADGVAPHDFCHVL